MKKNHYLLLLLEGLHFGFNRLGLLPVSLSVLLGVLLGLRRRKTDRKGGGEGRIRIFLMIK